MNVMWQNPIQYHMCQLSGLFHSVIAIAKCKQQLQQQQQRQYKNKKHNIDSMIVASLFAN